MAADWGYPPQVAGFSQIWRESSSAEQVDDITSLVSSNHALQTALTTLKKTVGEHDYAAVAAVAEVEDLIAAIDKVTHKMVETRFFNYQHGSTATTADRFFDVTEIYERVLMDLSMADVLSTQQVNKRTYAVIESSKTLQRKFHLLQDPEAELYGLELRPLSSPRKEYPCYKGRVGYDDTSGLSIDFYRAFKSHTYGEGLAYPTVRVQVPASIYSSAAKAPGSRIRRMLLCQPPVTVMDVTIGCCLSTSMREEDYVEKQAEDGRSPDRHRQMQQQEWLAECGGAFKKVSNNEGITIGDLYGVCVQLAEQHKLCASAPVTMHDGDGWVRPHLYLDGILPQETRWPEEAEYYQKPAMEEQHRREQLVHEYLIQLFVWEKQQAAEDGEPVPSFAQFKAANDDVVRKAWHDVQQGHPLSVYSNRRVG